MTKRANRYRLTLEQLEQNSEEKEAPASLQLEFDNHDELFGIIERARQKNMFGDLNQTTEFVIGLKMFGEVMLKNRDNPLFAELSPAFGDFMKKLKRQ